MIEVRIPKAGMSTVEVDVIAVHVAADDAAKVGDVIARIAPASAV